MRDRPSHTLLGLRRARGGSAALEFAMTAPSLVLIMAGAISFGEAYRVKAEVNDAAHAGAVYASAHGFSQSGITSAAQGATPLSTAVSVSSSESTASCINPATGAITSAGGAQTCPGTGSAPGSYVTVTAQFAYQLILAPPGIAPAMTMASVAVARIQ